MKLSSLKLAALIFGACGIANAAISTISFGNLNVGVNNAIPVNGSTSTSGGVNGQPVNNGVNPGGLANLSFSGIEIYNVQDAIRDNGFGLGASGFTTFNSNYIGSPAFPNSSVTGFTVSGSGIGQQVVVSGTYTGGGMSTVGNWTRTYTFVNGDILREVVTFTNTSGGALSNLRIWGAFDPDQAGFGPGSAVVTSNTTGTLSGFRFARAILPGGNINAILASNDPGVNVNFISALGGFLTPMTVACLDALVGIAGSCTVGASSGPSDQAYAYAVNFSTIANGGSVSSTVYHIFGTGGSSFNLAGAFAAITGSSTSSTTSTTSTSSGEIIPEPGTMSLLGGACLAFGLWVRRRKQ